jgi:hypothetical protein
MWAKNWGQMVWGTALAVPGLGFWATLLLGALLALVAVRFLPRMRPWPTALVVVSFALLVPIAARALPFTFTNGTVADANQVNADFAAVSVTTVGVRTSSLVSFVSPGSTPVFIGPTSQFTTAANQRITGVVTAQWSCAAGSMQVSDGLCYRVAGSAGAPAYFNGASAGATECHGGLPVTVAAADTVVPGVGTWEVGRCIQNGSNLDVQINQVTGWYQLTN